MKYFRTCATWGLAVVAIVLCPITLIFAIPLAIGIGLDVFDHFGKAPVALALCAPVAFTVLRRMSPRALVHQLSASPARSRQPLGGSAGLTAEPNYAPKSMS